MLGLFSACDFLLFMFIVNVVEEFCIMLKYLKYSNVTLTSG